MSVISTVAATPSRLKLIYRYLENRVGEDYERLVQLSAPTVSLKNLNKNEIIDDSDDREDEQSLQIVENTIKEGVALGLFSREGDRISVAAKVSVSDIKKYGFGDAFGTVLERLLIKDTSPSQIDFPYALSWFMCQEPQRPLDFSVNQTTVLQNQIGNTNNYKISSGPRWQMFCYWSRAIGYATFMGASVGKDRKTLVIPDCTTALRRHLRNLLIEGINSPLPGLISEIANLSTVLDRGRHRMEVENRMINRRDSGRLSRSLSFALKRLELKEVIKLSVLPDAQVEILDLGSNTQRVSHVMRLRNL